MAFNYDPNQDLEDLLNEQAGFDASLSLASSLDNEIHLRVRKRNARKAITTVEGLDYYINNGTIDMKKLQKFIKTRLCCAGTIQEDKDGKKVLQVSGDQRDEITDILTGKYGIKESDIVKHGF